MNQENAAPDAQVDGVVMRASAVCGNCGKQWDKHHHEDEAYCNLVTNGDIFTDDPSDDAIMAWIRDRHLLFVNDEIAAWKRANGHA